MYYQKRENVKNSFLGVASVFKNEGFYIGKYETTGELWDRLSKIGADLLVQSLEQIENGIAKRKEQGNNLLCRYF